MKKLIALLLVTVFMFSLVGCGGDSESNTNNNGNTDKDNSCTNNNSNTDSNNNIGGADTPENAVKTYFKSNGNLDLDSYMKISLYYNKDVVLKYTDKTGEDLKKLEETFDTRIEGLEAIDIDDQEKYTVKFDYVEEKRDITDNYDDIFDNMGISHAVEDFVWVDFLFTAEQNGEFEEVSNDAPCVKIGGKWYIVFQF